MLSERSFLRRWTWVLVGVMIVVLIGTLLWLLASINGDQSSGAVTPGKLESVLVIPGPGKGELPQFARPLGVTWGPKNDIYVSDTGNARVCVFTERGRFLREIGRVATDAPESQRAVALVQPAGLAVREDGTLLVADLAAGVVREYNRAGKYVRSIQPPASGPAAAKWAPTDVVVHDGNIYVTDARGVAVFSDTGELTKRYDQSKEGVPFVRPVSAAVLRNGTIVVSDSNARQVVAVSTAGGQVWSTEKVAGKSGGVFGLPRGISVMNDDSILAVDAFKFVLVHVASDGQILGSYGGRGSSPTRFQYPNDVDVLGDLVLVADKENNRVQVVKLPTASDAPK